MLKFLIAGFTRDETVRRCRAGLFHEGQIRQRRQAQPFQDARALLAMHAQDITQGECRET
jgi:hypothetical protein